MPRQKAPHPQQVLLDLLHELKEREEAKDFPGYRPQAYGRAIKTLKAFTEHQELLHPLDLPGKVASFGPVICNELTKRLQELCNLNYQEMPQRLPPAPKAKQKRNIASAPADHRADAAGAANDPDEEARPNKKPRKTSTKVYVPSRGSGAEAILRAFWFELGGNLAEFPVLFLTKDEICSTVAARQLSTKDMLKPEAGSMYPGFKGIETLLGHDYLYQKNVKPKKWRLTQEGFNCVQAIENRIAESGPDAEPNSDLEVVAIPNSSQPIVPLSGPSGSHFRRGVLDVEAPTHTGRLQDFVVANVVPDPNPQPSKESTDPRLVLSIAIGNERSKGHADATENVAGSSSSQIVRSASRQRTSSDAFHFTYISPTQERVKLKSDADSKMGKVRNDLIEVVYIEFMAEDRNHNICRKFVMEICPGPSPRTLFGWALESKFHHDCGNGLLALELVMDQRAKNSMTEEPSHLLGFSPTFSAQNLVATLMSNVLARVQPQASEPSTSAPHNLTSIQQSNVEPIINHTSNTNTSRRSNSDPPAGLLPIPQKQQQTRPPPLSPIFRQLPPAPSHPAPYQLSPAPSSLRGNPNMNQFQNRIESFVPGAENRLACGTYEIVLLLDKREKGVLSDSNSFRDVLMRKGINVETRALSTADVAFVARKRAGGKEAVLKWLIERKRLDDLIQSDKTGHLLEQHLRMQRSGLDPQLVIEDYSVTTGSTAEKSRDLNTFFQIHGMTVKTTKSLNDTAEYLKLVYEEICSFHRRDLTDLYVIPKESVSKATYMDLLKQLRSTYPSKQCLPSFDAFQKVNNKIGLDTVHEVWKKSLIALKGLNMEHVETILKLYPTPTHIWKAYQKADTMGIPLERMMMTITDSVHYKKLTLSQSRTIYQFVYEHTKDVNEID